MSLQLTERRAKENLYSILVSFSGIIPVYFMSVALANISDKTLYLSFVFLPLLATFYFDIMNKRNLFASLIISFFLHLTTISSLVGFILNDENPLLYSSSVFFMFLSLFSLSPITISDERLKNVKSRVGSKGFEDALVLREVPFKNSALSPLDLQIFADHNFRKFLLGDYFAKSAAAPPSILLAFTFAIIGTFLYQSFIPFVSIIHFFLVVPSTYLLGFSIRLYLTKTFAKEDLMAEVKYRLEKDPKEAISKISSPMRITAAIGFVLGVLALLITPQFAQRSPQFIDLTNPSDDFLLPLILPIIFATISLVRRLWISFWNNIPDVNLQEAVKKKIRKNTSARKKKK